MDPKRTEKISMKRAGAAVSMAALPAMSTGCQMLDADNVRASRQHCVNAATPQAAHATSEVRPGVPFGVVRLPAEEPVGQIA
ncbi:hypothetical protein GCM10028833_39270 [Glycomyces tarimensis]